MLFKISKNNRAKVLVTLYNNAAKSENTKSTLINTKFPIVGRDPSFYFRYETEIEAEIRKLTLTEAEAEAILAKNLYINYIGFVRIAIDFNGTIDPNIAKYYEDVINTSVYDKVNKTSLTAEEILFKEHQITPFSFTEGVVKPTATSKYFNTTSNISSLFASTSKSNVQPVSIEIKVLKLLNEISQKNCSMPDKNIFSFSEHSDALILKKLTDFLKSHGLEIEYISSKPLLGGAFYTNPNLEFRCPLETLLEKIQLFKETQNNTNQATI